MAERRERCEAALGLSPSDAETSTRVFFAAFRWDPPRVDPHFVTARAFLDQLEKRS